MRTLTRTSLPVLIVLLGVLACAVPELAQVDQSAAATSVAETVLAIVQQTQKAAGISLVASDTPPVTSTATATPEPPTFTPTPTLSPTPIFTVTPLVPLISVSVPTNCRVGPGKVYEMVGALLVGEIAQVHGRDPTGNYWYIRNPDDPGHYCWVWGEYATLSGLVSVVPVFTPLPTPTLTFTPTPAPGFDASFGGLEYCSAWWIDLDLENTGTVTFKSVSLTVTDTETSTVVASIEDGFTDETGCSTTTSRKALAPGKTVGESSPTFSYDITGHKLHAAVTLCSDTGLNGTCVTETLTFRP